MAVWYQLADLFLSRLDAETAHGLAIRSLKAGLVPADRRFFLSVTLAGLGTVISATVVAIGTMLALDWPAAPAVVFGALIAATVSRLSRSMIARGVPAGADRPYQDPAS